MSYPPYATMMMMWILIAAGSSAKAAQPSEMSEETLLRLKLLSYDADESFQLDQYHELEAVGCSEWTRLDSESRLGLGEGLWTFFMVADEGPEKLVDLGVSPKMHAKLWTIWSHCGLAELPTHSDRGARLAANRLRGTVGALQTYTPEKTESLVREVFLGVADRDSDGKISQPELSNLPCEMWHAADSMSRKVWGDAVFSVYGMSAQSTQSFLSRLGFESGLEAHASRHALECGVGPDRVVASQTLRTSGSALVLGLEIADAHEWELDVALLVQQRWDRDRSGEVDTPEEVEAVACSTWDALDRGVRWTRPAGLLRTYGFAGPSLFRGTRIGFSADVRAEIGRAAVLCGLDLRTWSPKRDLNNTEGEFEPSVDITPSIGGLPNPGSRGWDRSLKELLTRAADFDASGQLDAPMEVRSVECATWREMDRRLRGAGKEALYQRYRIFSVRSYRGDRLGLPVESREVMQQRMTRCGLAPDSYGLEPLLDRDRRALEQLNQVSAAPGTSQFHEQLRVGLITHYDGDDSGALDTVDEVKGVPCEVWWTLQVLSLESWDLTLTQAYGLDSRGRFVDGALGLHPSVRRLANNSLRRCEDVLERRP